ncbi:hypothetical protein GCM10028813_19100 [Ramlibacter alkalitolerans]
MFAFQAARAAKPDGDALDSRLRGNDGSARLPDFVIPAEAGGGLNPSMQRWLPAFRLVTRIPKSLWDVY